MLEKIKGKIDPASAIVFCVVFAGICTLVALDKVPAETLKYLLLWLIPSPLGAQNGEVNK